MRPKARQQNEEPERIDMPVGNQAEQDEQDGLDQEPIPQTETNEFTLLLMNLERIDVSEEKLQTLKDRYGNVYISYIHEGGSVVFVWRKLSRGEYKQIAESGALAKDMTYQDAVLRKCLLAPKPDSAFFISSDAGVVPTLFSQIMYQSGFVPEHIALSNIIEI